MQKWICKEQEPFMDFETLRKKLEAYKTPGGSYKNIKGALLVELLRMWEEHKCS
jgi:hypothetical protein